MAKTYTPELFKLEQEMIKYITKHQITLQAGVSEGTYTCILALLSALKACAPLIKPPPPST